MEHPTPPEAWAFLAFCACCYFCPTWIAFRRRIPTRWDVLFLNLFLGWTGIGYLFCMFCAVGTKPVGAASSTP